MEKVWKAENIFRYSTFHVWCGRFSTRKSIKINRVFCNYEENRFLFFPEGVVGLGLFRLGVLCGTKIP